jgi:citrate lyase subunit beta/citryl-CoA lyase
MLPKAETLRDLEALAAYAVIALCESPLGVENASLLAAAPMVTGLMWGAEDLVAALGGSTSRHPDGRYRDVARYARSRVLLAAAAAGTAAFDTVHLDIADTAGLRDEAEDAAATGFAGTVCIHPSQVPVVRAAYAPLPEDVARARRVVEAAADAGGGVFTLDGRMVDEPLLRQARRVLEMAARTAS